MDAPNLRLCARIEIDVPAGTYYVEVTGWEGGVGTYAVRVAEGS